MSIVFGSFTRYSIDDFSDEYEVVGNSKDEVIKNVIPDKDNEDDTFEEEEQVDMKEIANKIESLEKELETVKKAMQDASGKCICPPGLPYCMCGAKDYGNIITKKPILPDNKEIQDNTRSKSAKLRIFERNSKDFN